MEVLLPETPFKGKLFFRIDKIVAWSSNLTKQTPNSKDLYLLMNSSSTYGHQKTYTFTGLALVIILAATQLFIFTPLAFSETQYVIPSSEIPVRRGQGTDYKIVALVKDGTPVEVLEQNDSYSRVKLENDKEGWILTRFLSPELPLTEVVDTLGRENDELKLQIEESRIKIDELNVLVTEKETALQEALSEADTLTTSYDKLKKDTADVVKIKSNYSAATQENQKLKKQLTQVMSENDKLKSDDRINWFLAGGGVLLVGLIIGKITSGSRRRKPSLL